jgi:hypothetical protein
MEHARVSVGMQRDEKGEPLVTANELLLGTVRQVREFLDEYEGEVVKQRWLAAHRSVSA